MKISHKHLTACEVSSLSRFQLTLHLSESFAKIAFHFTPFLGVSRDSRLATRIPESKISSHLIARVRFFSEGIEPWLNSINVANDFSRSLLKIIVANPILFYHLLNLLSFADGSLELRRTRQNFRKINSTQLSPRSRIEVLEQCSLQLSTGGW